MPYHQANFLKNKINCNGVKLCQIYNVNIATQILKILGQEHSTKKGAIKILTNLYHRHIYVNFAV